MKELFKYSDELNDEELKKKRKIFYKLAWVYGLIGIIIFIVAMYQYFMIGYIGLTVIFMGIFVIAIIGAVHMKNSEADCSIMIDTRKTMQSIGKYDQKGCD